MLNECLTVLVSFSDSLSVTLVTNLLPPNQKGNHVDRGAQARETNGHQQKIPTSWDDVKIYGNIAFNHKTLPRSKTLQPTSPSTATVTGRLDYCIGRVLPETRRRRRFQSLLVIVEAKAQRAVGQALPHLLAYLACLRQSRLQQNRTYASVYGISSDGYLFIFVNITHDGTVKISRNFDILQGEMPKVLGCLRYLLGTAKMGFNVTPGRPGGDWVGGDDLADIPIDLHDNDYTNPPQDENEIY